MARIKFLDVLEETKRKPSLNYEEDHSLREPTPREHIHQQSSYRESSFDNDFSREHAHREHGAPSQPNFRERSFRERVASHEPRMNRTAANPAASFLPRRSEKIEQEDTNTKIVWIASLFVFLGGILFLGGYWMGNAFKRDMPADRINIENAVTPVIPLDPASIPMMTDPVSQPAASSKPIPVIKPVTAAPVKKTPAKAATKKSSTPAKAKSDIGNGEFVIQVSAHTSISAARATEQRLLDSGIENVYISENYMGDNQKIFRVRVRNGFRSEAEAKKALPAIRSAVGLADNDGRIIRLD
ncbi:MAG: SPOR domain-containing protein [Brevinema sp.]